MERGVFTPDLDQTITLESVLSSFDVDVMSVEALLFQTGYLTIISSRFIAGRTEYRLGYPNLEVQTALNDVLLKSLIPGGVMVDARMGRLYDTLVKNDFSALETHLKSLFASIPHDWHRKNDIARYEGYYASVFYSHFAALGLDIRVEDATSQGKVDMTVLFNNVVLIFEFKVVEIEPGGRAMEQLLNKAYADKYMDRGEPVFLIGVEFSREKHELVGFEVETVGAGP